MKKAQIQNMESITVVIIIMILIVVGIFFSFGLKKDSAEKQASKNKELDSIAIAFKVAGLREIKCSRSSESGNTCFDLYRLKALSELTQYDTLDANKYYIDMFGTANIAIKPIYPEITIDSDGNSVERIVVYEYKMADGKKITKSTPSFFPVLLYDPLEDKNIFAMMEIMVFK